nr:helix-turn-helix transcriptional regulator [Gilliamella apicola]
MLTPFGKAVRKMRIDLGMSLSEMAKKANKTSSYFSAIETGKRAVTEPLLETVISILCQNRNDEKVLRVAAKETVETVDINLIGKTDAARDFTLSFARRFDELNDDDFESLSNILNKNNK